MSFEVLNPGHGGALVKSWTQGVTFDDNAKLQVLNTAKMPFIFKHMAVMPDVHWGMGSTIGTVLPTIGAIIPATVGVDIGCGMSAYRTTLNARDLPTNMKNIRDAIERAVPHGRTNNGRIPGDWGAWHDVPEHHTRLWVNRLNAGYQDILEKHPKIKAANSLHHLGTLGTGNHFVEVCLDEENAVWIMLHSGSRGIGNKIGMYFIELAKIDMRKWFINLPDENLAYFPQGTQYFDDYVKAVSWAQNFARQNRIMMMINILEKIKGLDVLPPFELTDLCIDCHHNYVAWEHHFGTNVMVTRKGAVRARLGDLGIIPGSMGVKSYIVRGKGNADSFHTCSHGAGRTMSRGQARKTITLVDHENATLGVECKKDESVLDESPAAYKNIDRVMAAQEDLVEIVHTLKQIVCVKG